MNCNECSRKETCDTCKSVELDKIPDGVKFSCHMFRSKYANQNIENNCSGCVYENIDAPLEYISNCVCCSRNFSNAKNDNYRKRQLCMVISKRFDCTIEDIDSVVVALAKEIEDGWHISKIENHGFTFNYSVRRDEPEFSIELVKRKCC